MVITRSRVRRNREGSGIGGIYSAVRRYAASSRAIGNATTIRYADSSAALDSLITRPSNNDTSRSACCVYRASCVTMQMVAPF